MDDPGFDFSVLSEFRDRMAEGDRADRLLAVMVERLVEAGLVKRRGRQRTDSTHVLAAVRRLDRIELVGETIRAALEELVCADEDGCLHCSPTTGPAAMAGRCATTGCPRKQRNGSSTPSRSARTACACCGPSSGPAPRSGCGRCHGWR